MKSKILSFAIYAVLLTALIPHGFTAWADDSVTLPDITVSIDGTPINFADQQPIIWARGRTLVPGYEFAQAIGAVVEWDMATPYLTVSKGNTVISMSCDSERAVVDGVDYDMGAPAHLMNDYVNNTNTLMLPVRFIAETLGYTVDWDQDRQTVLISSGT